MRRYELDWLRVIVFALLIFYHVGMFFVPWDFHIKNNIIYDWLRWPMLFLNQWRLSILFVISGMGTYYALGKRTGVQFSKERTSRLLLPLVFGMLVIVPPQVYLERVADGQFTGSYFDFWPLQAFIGTYPEGNLSWHHLWFLPYLLLFSLLLSPLFLYLKKHPDNFFLSWIKTIISSPSQSYVLVFPLFLIYYFLKPLFPVTHALVGDWFSLSWYLVMFFYGFVLLSSGEVFWKTACESRRLFLVSGLAGFVMLMLVWFGLEDLPYRHLIEGVVKTYNIWSWMMALFGYASRYLNHGSRLLAYSNEAVYPFYILHQTIMIIIGFYVMDLDWGFGAKASLMVIGTFLSSWILYDFVVKRTRILRPLFGLKPEKDDSLVKKKKILATS